MNHYELERLADIRRWQAEPPPPVARWFGKAAGPASQAVQDLIPSEALRTALAAVQMAAERLGDPGSLLRQAGVERIEDLRARVDLATCDALSARVRKRAMAVAGGTGAVFGVAGGAGMIADVPTLLLLAFRTIHRVGLCYGEPLEGEAARRLSLGVFALASANTVEEKTLAIGALSRSGGRFDAVHAAWRDGVERVAERELAKEAAMLSVNNLARQASKHLGWRKAAGSLPVIGAVVGGSVNAWYLYDLASVARYCFQERWLWARYGELDKARPPALDALSQTG